jgi:hypothetical protein
VTNLKNKPRKLNPTEQRKIDHTFSILGTQFKENIDKIYGELEQSKKSHNEKNTVKKIDEDTLYRKNN